MTQGSPDPADLNALSGLAPELARTFVSIASDIALVIDRDGVIRDVALGRTPLSASATEWVGRRWSDTVKSDSRGKIEGLLREVADAGVSRRREINHDMGTGADLPIAYSAIRLGEHGPVLAVGRDLRAVAAMQQRFVEAQQELERDYWRKRQAESRYRMLFQVATDAVMVIDAASSCIVDANEAAAQLLDLPVDQLVDKPATSGLEAGSRPVFDELLLRTRLTGRPDEIRVRLARNRVSALVSATPFRDDSHAEGALLVLVRARALDADADAGRALADFVERTPDAVAITDSTGRVLVGNPALARLAGGARDGDFTGQRLAQLIGDPQGALAQVLADVRRHGIVAQRRILGGHSDATLSTFEVSAALLPEGEQECIGLSLRRVDRFQGLQAEVASRLAPAIALVGERLGQSPLAQVMQSLMVFAERQLVEMALERSGGNAPAAAVFLGVDGKDFGQYLERHGLAAGGDARS